MTVELANEALTDSWRLSLHNKAPRTVALYLQELGRFAAWLVEDGRPKASPGDLAAVQRSDVEAFRRSSVERIGDGSPTSSFQNGVLS